MHKYARTYYYVGYKIREYFTRNAKHKQLDETLIDSLSAYFTIYHPITFNVQFD